MRGEIGESYRCEESFPRCLTAVKLSSTSHLARSSKERYPAFPYSLHSVSHYFYILTSHHNSACTVRNISVGNIFTPRPGREKLSHTLSHRTPVLLWNISLPWLLCPQITPQCYIHRTCPLNSCFMTWLQENYFYIIRRGFTMKHKRKRWWSWADLALNPNYMTAGKAFNFPDLSFLSTSGRVEWRIYKKFLV